MGRGLLGSRPRLACGLEPGVKQFQLCSLAPRLEPGGCQLAFQHQREDQTDRSDEDVGEDLKRVHMLGGRS